MLSLPKFPFIQFCSVRLGFATNSSSSHSLILLDDGATLSDNAPDYWHLNFGWDWFTCATKEAKSEYLAAQLATDLGIPWSVEGKCETDEERERVRRAYNEPVADLIEEITGVRVGLSEGGDLEAYVDHQSAWHFPRRWDGENVLREFVEAVKTFVLRDHVAVLGGNDNDDMSHPAASMGHHVQYPVQEAGGGDCWVARYDELLHYWTFFNRSTGARLRGRLVENVPGETTDTFSLMERNSYRDPEKPKPVVQASVPELVDLKVTDHCGFGCSFCYQDSTAKGRHGSVDYIREVIDALANLQVFEIAIGGGEPTSHPDLDAIVDYALESGIIPNMTTRSLEWIREAPEESLQRFGGVAYSVHSPKDVADLGNALVDRFGDQFKRPCKFNGQYVLGTGDRAQFRAMLTAACEARLDLTLLDYKEVGRGGRTHQPKDYSWWPEVVQEWRESPEYGCRLHIDTPLAAKFQPQLERLEVPSWCYDVQDGAFSFYIDAVQSLCAPSSYEPDLIRREPLHTSAEPLHEAITRKFRMFQGQR